jgi:LysR family transcriptional regulator, transcriptional activator of the cysJI operon
MYIDTFKVFCDLVDTGSFSKSASVNGITQSAVSQQIRALEDRFKCTLIERGRRHLSLTPEGMAFHKTCKSILDLWDQFEGRLNELKNIVAGEIKIASIYSIGLHELPPRLKAFREAHPEVEVRVDYRRSPQVYEMVESGEADIGLVAYPTKNGLVTFEVFDEDRLAIICHPRHALASRQAVTLEALNDERFIAFEPDTPTRKVIDRTLRDAGVRVTQVAEFDNIETVKRAVEIESGVSIVPANTVTQEVANGQLAMVAIETPKLTRPLGILLSRTRPRPAGLKEFMVALKGV